MPRNASATRGMHFEVFIAEQVQDGDYGSASEFLRAGNHMTVTVPAPAGCAMMHQLGNLLTEYEFILTYV